MSQARGSVQESIMCPLSSITSLGMNFLVFLSGGAMNRAPTSLSLVGFLDPACYLHFRSAPQATNQKKEVWGHPTPRLGGFAPCTPKTPASESPYFVRPTGQMAWNEQARHLAARCLVKGGGCFWLQRAISVSRRMTFLRSAGVYSMVNSRSA